VRRLVPFASVLILAFALSSWEAPAASADTELAVTSPVNGVTVSGRNVTVRFRVSGIRLVPTNVPISQAGQRPDANRPGEGHVHFMLDTQPLVVWERPDAYTFSDIPPGEHQLMVEVVQNDHGALDPPVAQTIRFRTTALFGNSGGGSEPRRVGMLFVLGAALAAAGGALAWRRRPWLVS
jgi:hypothetical protein